MNIHLDARIDCLRVEMVSHLQRSVLGMFDVSARPCVAEGLVAISVPVNKFVRMVDNMEESFLVTPSWNKLKKRTRKGEKR